MSFYSKKSLTSAKVGGILGVDIGESCVLFFLRNFSFSSLLGDSDFGIISWKGIAGKKACLKFELVSGVVILLCL